MNLIEVTASRTISAPPDKLFDAWIDPTVPGGPWFGTERVIINPVVDGLFFHAVKHEGKLWAHYGRFVKLDRPRCIEFTWMSEATKGVESVVLFTLEPKGNQTEVTLNHSRLPDDEMGRQHEMGWNWALQMLAEKFALKSPTA